MKLTFILPFTFPILFISCFDNSKQNPTENKVLRKDSLQSKELKPDFGYRFIIHGDFNGDGKKEKLVEHYFSALDHKETNKFYYDIEYDSMVVLAMRKEPFSFVLCDDKVIDTLRISSARQLFGLSYLKSEGDLNGDGGDEISYVVDFADWSSLNTWYIMTYTDDKWKKLYSFPIWDWQLTNFDVPTPKEEFKGLVQKIATNKIQIFYRTEEADLDTAEVDLKELN
jgi:hypothetical protein